MIHEKALEHKSGCFRGFIDWLGVVHGADVDSKVGNRRSGTVFDDEGLSVETDKDMEPAK